MPTIAAGNTAEIYCPLATSVTFTPGSGGVVRLSVSAQSGDAAIVPKFIQAATSVAVTAGASLFAEAVGAAATYTDPAGQTADFASRVSGDMQSTAGIQRLHMALNPTTDMTGGAAKTFDMQFPAKRSFRGVRYVLMNTSASAVANYTAMRCGSAPKHLLSYGDEITWWPDLLAVNGDTSPAVPVATVGTTAGGAQRIPSFVITDFVPLQPVARVDQPTGLPLTRVRLRTAVESQNGHNVNGTYVTTWNAYVGADGMVIGSSAPSTDYVTSAPTDRVYQLAESGGPVQPIAAIFAYDDPGIQLWCFGDSLFQGVGTTVGSSVANGSLGWPTMIHIQQRRIDCLNQGVAGQNTEDSLAVMRALLVAADDPPQYVAFKVYSPNDGNPTQALVDQQWGRVLNACSYAKSRGARVLLLTCPPVDTWTSTMHGFIEELNARVFALGAQWGQVTVVDMAAAVSDPSNRRQLLPAYAYDATHYNDLGHQAIANAVVAAIT